MTMIYFINQLLGIGTILGQIFIVLSFVYILLNKKGNFLINLIGKQGILFAFTISLVSIIISLFYSDVAGFEPCTLCWYQRIFMYPQVFILGLALFKKDEGVIKYSLTLSAVGVLLAGYHYFLQLGWIQGLPCSAIGSSASCSKLFVMQFGYITIPMMSLTAFLMMITFLILYKKYKK